jgi:hypothetical protein
MVSFALKSLDLMLRMSPAPDALFEFGHRINRRLCGVRLRRQRVGGRVWPYLEGVWARV